jgi:hypothetical protein
MRIRRLIPVVIASVSPNLWAQTATNAISTSPPNSPPGQNSIREKYQAIQVDEFEVKQGVQFPPEYLKKAQDEIVKQLSDAKVMKEVLRTGQQPAQAGTPVLYLSGTINNYTPGSRAERYVVGGLGGLGASEVDVQIFLLDGATKQKLQTEKLRAVLIRGAFGGSEDKISNELARRVVLQTRFMLSARVPPAEYQPATSDPPAVSTQDRHILTVDTKDWEEQQKKLEQEAGAGYRVVDFSVTGKSTANVELEKVASAPDVFQYRWVHMRVYTHLQKELNKATSEGFHVFPQTLTALGPYLTVLIEKSPGPSPVQYHYLVTEPLRISSAQKDAETHQREDYRLLDETEFVGVHILLFEKTTEGVK